MDDLKVQIELIGCTSAGKSTLANSILEAHRAGGNDIAMAHDFVLSQARLDWVRNFLLRTLALDLIALSGCAAGWQRNRSFCRYAIRHIRRLPATVGVLEKLNLARNVLKNIGIHEIIRRRATDEQVVVVDEGTLHTAHSLFVHVSFEPDMNDIAAFVTLAPLPDIAVYVQQDECVLIERTLMRTHKRIPNHTDDEVKCFIKRAVNTFDNLARQSALKSRVLMMDSQREITTPPPASQDDKSLSDKSLSIAIEIVRAGLHTTEVTTEQGHHDVHA